MASPREERYPLVVKLERPERRLRIEWDDGHESVYSIRYLRGFCPCAVCQGHSQNTWTFVPSEDPELQHIEESGSYALSFTFSDGHDTGIYSFDILRELCPCDACRAEQGAAHAMARLPEGETV